MRYLPIELKAADPDAGTFSGYASVFENVDAGGDLIRLAGQEKRMVLAA
jgi:hypothetical protein